MLTNQLLIQKLETITFNIQYEKDNCSRPALRNPVYLLQKWKQEPVSR